MTIAFSPCTGIVCCPDNCDPTLLPMCACNPLISLDVELTVTVVSMLETFGGYIWEWTKTDQFGKWSSSLEFIELNQWWKFTDNFAEVSFTDDCLKVTHPDTSEYQYGIRYSMGDSGFATNRISSVWRGLADTNPTPDELMTDIYLDSAYYPCGDLNPPHELASGELRTIPGYGDLVMATWKIEVVSV